LIICWQEHLQQLLKLGSNNKKLNMKKIYYLLIAGVLGLAACQKEPALQSSTNTPYTGIKQSLNITLTATDYSKLASGYPKTSLTFDDLADANTYIPQILNTEYVTPANGSTAKVTYNQTALYFKAVDTTYKVTTAGTDTGTNAYYALTAADYLLLPGNKYTDFSVAQLLTWLPYKFPSPANNTLKVVSWTIYPTGTTPAVPYSFLYTDGAWRQIYMIQPAQYTTLGVGKYDQFTSAFTNIPQTMAALANVDPTVTDTIKKNDIIYVSYNYYVSATADYQRVQPLQWNGTSFVVPFATTASATFIKANGVWKPEPVVSYALTTADIAIIEKGAAGTTAAKANLTSYGDFSSAWATSDMDAAVIECLTVDFPTPATGTLYQISFPNYSSPAPNPLGFTWTGTAWLASQ
jgi:hypothetical protein